jgi:chemotaxis signal transduction protein
MSLEELSEFVDADAADSAERGQFETRVVRDLLIFEYSSELFAVEASSVEGVVPWKPPVRIPGTDARVRGVIQDRGRIVVVMSHPTGRTMSDVGEAKRVIICATPRGYVGLPAAGTNSVGPVELASAPSAFSVHDAKGGPLTYLDPRRYSEEP